jgi:uncharacterized protein YjiS (DUF1127 family)
MQRWPCSEVVSRDQKGGSITNQPTGGIAGNQSEDRASDWREAGFIPHIAIVTEILIMNSSVKPGNYTHIEVGQTNSQASRGIASIVSRYWSSMLRERELRKGISVLQTFDDHMLKDIGVSRHEIEKVGRHGRSNAA